jgi:transcriptional regulator of acetoin/glycerol metabolism
MNRPKEALRARPELDGDAETELDAIVTELMKERRCATLAQIIDTAITRSLKRTGGNVMHTALELGIDRRTVYRRLAATEKAYAASPVRIGEQG